MVKDSGATARAKRTARAPLPASPRHDRRPGIRPDDKTTFVVPTFFEPTFLMSIPLNTFAQMYENGIEPRQ
jgi:hypothetical protein